MPNKHLRWHKKYWVKELKTILFLRLRHKLVRFIISKKNRRKVNSSVWRLRVQSKAFTKLTTLLWLNSIQAWSKVIMEDLKPMRKQSFFKILQTEIMRLLLRTLARTIYLSSKHCSLSLLPILLSTTRRLINSLLNCKHLSSMERESRQTNSNLKLLLLLLWPICLQEILMYMVKSRELFRLFLLSKSDTVRVRSTIHSWRKLFFNLLTTLRVCRAMPTAMSCGLISWKSNKMLLVRTVSKWLLPTKRWQLKNSVLETLKWPISTLKLPLTC